MWCLSLKCMSCRLPLPCLAVSATCQGGRVPPPIRTWAESALPWELIEAVKRANYERPTPIQMQAIPIALEQRDLIGIAETGSGNLLTCNCDPLFISGNRISSLREHAERTCIQSRQRASVLSRLRGYLRPNMGRWSQSSQ